MSAQAWLSGELEISLSGELGFQSAVLLDHQVKQILAEFPGGDWTLDMSGVLKVNSVALSLLMSWMRFLRPAQGGLKIASMPIELADLARVCGVDDFLQAC